MPDKEKFAAKTNAVDPMIRSVFRRRVAALAPLFDCCEPLAEGFGEADRAFDIARAEAFVAAYADTQRSVEIRPHRHTSAASSARRPSDA